MERNENPIGIGRWKSGIHMGSNSRYVERGCVSDALAASSGRDRAVPQPAAGAGGKREGNRSGVCRRAARNWFLAPLRRTQAHSGDDERPRNSIH